MADFSPIGDDPSDDLPRTFRREKEARAREARERAAKERAAAPSLSTAPEAPRYAASAPQMDARIEPEPALMDMPYPATIRRFDVPFFHLMTFLIKVVLAGVPALLLLGCILWALGHGLQTLFPELVKMKILVSFPN